MAVYKSFDSYIPFPGNANDEGNCTLVLIHTYFTHFLIPTQHFRLDSYFCTLVLIHMCILYTFSFPPQQSLCEMKTARLASCTILVGNSTQSGYNYFRGASSFEPVGGSLLVVFSSTMNINIFVSIRFLYIYL